MKSKSVKRRLAMLTASAMTVAMLGMNVCAAGVVTDTNGITSIDVGKTVTTDGNTFKPNTSFSFEVALGAAGTYDNNVVYAGVTDGLKPAAAAVSAPSANDTLSSSYTISGGSLAVDVSKFDKPGVYHYVVTETQGTYEGIAYDNSSFDVYLYVYNGNGCLYVGNVVSVKNGTKADLAFVNDYGKNNDTTHDVTVTKEVKGNQADLNKGFQFDVSVNGGEGEYYKVVVKETATSTAVTSAIASGANAVTYTIKNGGSIQIFGLSESDGYTINEHDYSGDGYVTTNRNNTGNATEDGTCITVTNTKNAGIPTGIITTIVPFALMVILAAVVAAVFLRRKNREEF